MQDQEILGGHLKQQEAVTVKEAQNLEAHPIVPVEVPHQMELVKVDLPLEIAIVKGVHHQGMEIVKEGQVILQVVHP